MDDYAQAVTHQPELHRTILAIPPGISGATTSHPDARRAFLDCPATNAGTICRVDCRNPESDTPYPAPRSSSASSSLAGGAGDVAHDGHCRLDLEHSSGERRRFVRLRQPGGTLAPGRPSHRS